MKSTRAYIMFADIKGFSKLQESEYQIFSDIFEDISTIFFEDIKSDELISLNTWGDAVVIVSKNKDIVNNILKFRDYFKNNTYKDGRDFEKREISELKVRIACHYGKFSVYHNKLTKKDDFIGHNINLAARIEPKTRPNEIFVSKEFKDNYKNSGNIKFEHIGVIPLAKDFGNHEIYVLRKSDEEVHLMDSLDKYNLLESLPDIEVLSKELIKSLEVKYKNKTQRDILNIINTIDKDKSIQELYFLASLCKNNGYYKEANKCVQLLKDFSIDVENIQVYPYQTDIKLLKIEANSLTREGKYEEAGAIVYNLWKSGNTDGDTLSMLAAQYKRRACYDENDNPKKEFTEALLVRSLYLYLEAFRIAFVTDEAYYPAINAAFISKIIGGAEHGKYCTNLTHYIITEWKNKFGTDLWLDLSIAQAYLLREQYDISIEKFRDILERDNIDVFEIQSTIKQIELYKQYEYNSRNKDELDKIILLLKSYIY